MIELAIWCFGGFFAFALLHRIRSWPSSQWFGWVCFAAAGPLVWLFFLMTWLTDT
jgi:hypothetical protein